MRLRSAAIAAAAGRDCDRRLSGANEASNNCRFARRLLTTRAPRRCHAGAAARPPFRFASVARGPCFPPEPVNLAPDCDGSWQSMGMEELRARVWFEAE